ncbi:MAG: family 43 glycosylhydrolase [Candidatus Sumerlaeia bacterium]|nr:family 43 glycosylhydrolase [Candidatus Sumerlaeia bacterium]
MNLCAARLLVGLLVLLPAALAAQSNRLIDGLPRLKDPTVLAFGGDGETSPAAHLLVAMERGGALRGYWLEGRDVTRRVAIELPEAPGLVRWGPSLLRHEGRLYLYSGRGIAHNWPTFRLAVAVADENTDVEWDEHGRLARVRFSEEHMLPLPPGTAFGGWQDFGLIDPEVVALDGRLWLYAVAVTHGIAGVRHHESHIFARALRAPLEPEGPIETIYVGRAGPPDDGVAEAPTVRRAGDHVIMVISSRPSDNAQYLALLRSTQPFGAPWTDRRVLFAVDPALEPWCAADEVFERNGVGGQTMLFIAGRPHVLYQGLGDGPGQRTYDFRLALIDVGQALE